MKKIFYEGLEHFFLPFDKSVRKKNCVILSKLETEMERKMEFKQIEKNNYSPQA